VLFVARRNAGAEVVLAGMQIPLWFPQDYRQAGNSTGSYPPPQDYRQSGGSPQDLGPQPVDYGQPQRYARPQSSSRSGYQSGGYYPQPQNDPRYGTLQ